LERQHLSKLEPPFNSLEEKPEFLIKIDLLVALNVSLFFLPPEQMGFLSMLFIPSPLCVEPQLSSFLMK
jgi:hypothetical protein